MALKINPQTGEIYDDDPNAGWQDVFAPGQKSNSNWAVDIPASRSRAYKSTGTGIPGGIGGIGSGTGASGYGGGAVSSTPTGSATYTPPKAVDRTNVYEKKLLSLLDNPDSIANTGAYKFRFNQGQQALERSAAAKGMTGSGNTLAALADYGQGMASQAYNTEADRLGNLTGVQKNYIRDLLNVANQESATANQFTLGNQKNAVDWNLGTDRNSIDRMRMQNEALLGAQKMQMAKGGYESAQPFQVSGGFGGNTPQWQQDASRNFFNTDQRALAYAY
jgi:hypothetical protein